MLRILKYLVFISFITKIITGVDLNKNIEDSLEINNNFRLPKSIRPENYKLEIFTHLNDLEGFTFRGTVEITINIVEFTNNITLHAKNLTIIPEEIQLHDSSNNHSVAIENVEFITEHDFMIIYPQGSLLKSRKYVLRIDFEGPILNGFSGYFRTSYFDNEKQEDVWMSMTHFEPMYARFAFPCFDEPDLKATFDISLGHHKTYTALSNMPLMSSKPVKDMQDFVMDTFETSVLMSTYLVAYSVSDYTYKEVKMEDLTLRIYARREAINHAEYAAEITPKIVNFFGNYLSINYSLPKLDMIAVPGFGGGMENWGLINYGEQFLLLNPETSSVDYKFIIAGLIAHEVAHQWFGNLVTMKWWNDVWLNEGFATYFASLGVDHISPEWRTNDEELVREALVVFDYDSLNTTQPLSPVIKNLNHVEQTLSYLGFIVINYQKGSLVNRMCNNFLGEDAFRLGISKYLKKHQYGNTIQNDLLESLSAISNLDEELSIKEIMDSWTLQSGYPVVQVIRDYKTNSATLVQSRYVSDQEFSKDELERCWWIPLTYTNGLDMNFTQTKPNDWMTCNKKNEPTNKIIKNLPDDNYWIILNNQLSALYRVQYDEHNYKLITATLNSDDYSKIHVLNRVQLIADVLDFAFDGRISYDISLDLLEYLKRETEYLPWMVATNRLFAIEYALYRCPLLKLFRAYVRNLLEPIYEKLGGINAIPDAEDLYAVKHHHLITSWACRYDVADCVEKSIAHFDEWMTETEPDLVNNTPLNVRETTYCTAIRHGNTLHWSFLLERFISTNSTAERNAIIASLSCSKNKSALENLLKLSLDTKLMKYEDAVKVFSNVVKNVAGFQLAWKFLFERSDDISEIYNSKIFDLSDFIIPLAKAATTQKELGELKEFANKQFYESKKLDFIFEQYVDDKLMNTQWRSNSFLSLSSNLKRYFASDSQLYDYALLELQMCY